MIKVECLTCERELDTPGGLVISPPGSDTVTVQKGHLCTLCWALVWEMIETMHTAMMAKLAEGAS